jgi:hypothetical protein
MQRASSGPGRPWALIEITAGSDERKRTELIRAAYRSSRSGVVALALRGVATQVVDRALDSIVDIRRDRVKGVVYIDGECSQQELLAAAMKAEVVIAETEGFRAELLAHGIASVGSENGARFLLRTPEK